jgi:sugar/nucleoside kinase (ribokinase family)
VNIPDFLAVGHLCCDLIDGRRILGGSASYASLTARELGQTAGILTAIADDFPFLNLLRNISVNNIGSPSTTTFKNIYHNGIREQIISSVARTIRPADVPEELTGAAIVYLCPIANEVAPDVALCFRESLVGVGAQGWFREWDATGRVRKKKWESAIRVAEAVDAIVYSELDTDDPYVLAEELAHHAPIVIVTQSSQGADVFTDGRRIHVPAFEIDEIDPTGAGDVFAAAFLFHFQSSADVLASAKFACCAASFVCEQEGTRGIPTHEQVLTRLHQYNMIYSESVV